MFNNNISVSYHSEINVSVKTDITLHNLDFVIARKIRGKNEACGACRYDCGVYHIVILIQQTKHTTVTGRVEGQDITLKINLWDKDRRTGVIIMILAWINIPNTKGNGLCHYIHI